VLACLAGLSGDSIRDLSLLCVGDGVAFGPSVYRFESVVRSIATLASPLSLRIQYRWFDFALQLRWGVQGMRSSYYFRNGSNSRGGSDLEQKVGVSAGRVCGTES
jgi:hypothetical protein